MLGLIAYLVVLALIHGTEGESLYFWLWAGMGILFVLMAVAGLFLPESAEEKARRKRENRRKDEIAAMVIGLSDD